jgi:hypothetical protein
MTESAHAEAEVVEHLGYKIRLTHAGLDWIAAVALPKQRPVVIVAPDRDTTVAKAWSWIEARVATKDPE